MPEPKSLAGPEGAARAPEDCCRAWVRHAPRRETHSYLMPLSEEERWPATVLDISTGGIGLLLDRPVDAGRLVLVELISNSGHFSRLLLTRVIRFSEQPAGRYLLGGEFIGTLTANELQFLLS
jgi:hypothetical protein